MLRVKLADSIRSAADPHAAISNIIAVIREVLSDITIPMPARDDVLAWVGEIYDTVIAPMDIPYIGPMIENKIDAMLREILLKQVAILYDNLQRKRVGEVSQRAAA